MGEIYDNLSKEAKALFDVIEWIHSIDDGIRVCKLDPTTGLWRPFEITELGIKEKYGAMQ